MVLGTIHNSKHPLGILEHSPCWLGAPFYLACGSKCRCLSAWLVGVQSMTVIL